MVYLLLTLSFFIHKLSFRWSLPIFILFIVFPRASLVFYDAFLLSELSSTRTLSNASSFSKAPQTFA